MLAKRFSELRRPYYSYSLESRRAAATEKEGENFTKWPRWGRGPWPVFAHGAIHHGRLCPARNANPPHLKAARRPPPRSAGKASAPSQGLTNGGS